MLPLGLILIVIAALCLIAALVGGTGHPATFDLGLFEVDTNTLGVFLIGAGTVLVFVMGLELTRSGVRRANRRRKERKEHRMLAERYEREQGESATAEQPGTAEQPRAAEQTGTAEQPRTGEQQGPPTDPE